MGRIGSGGVVGCKVWVEEGQRALRVEGGNVCKYAVLWLVYCVS